MSALQSATSDAQDALPISNPKSLFNSNLSKNGEILPNATFLALFYYLTQRSKHNSAKPKDGHNNQQALNTSEDSENSPNLNLQEALNLSSSQDSTDFNNSMLFQLKNNNIPQNSQNNKIKNKKTKATKTNKKPKEGKTLKKHSDVTRPKFIRSKSQPTGSFLGRTEYLLFQQKKICIPDWKYIDSNNDLKVNTADTMQVSNDNNQSSDDKFDVKMHQRLEICENRIANGLTEYNHPAYSVQLESDESSKEIIPTETEKQKIANYESIVPQQQIPLFWEPRAWDTEESHMTDEDSSQLQLRIEQEESDESFYNLIRSKSKYNKKYYSYSYSSSSSSSQSSSSSLSPHDSPYSSSYSLGNIRKKKKESSQFNKDREKRRFYGTASDSAYSRRSTEIICSNYYYETDDSCDETDFELF